MECESGIMRGKGREKKEERKRKRGKGREEKEERKRKRGKGREIEREGKTGNCNYV